VQVISHLGEVAGEFDPNLVMEPVRYRLERLLPGVRLAENLRFDRGEITADPSFTRRLVRGADLFVNDAFATAHRRHASIVGPPAFLPTAFGRLFHRELEALDRLRQGPPRPFALVLGGAKVRDKLATVAALRDQVDLVLVGGLAATAFLDALGHSTGVPTPPAELGVCERLLASGMRVVLPEDLVVVHDQVVRVVGRDVPAGSRPYDIGPRTTMRFVEEVRKAGTVLWNGPMGRFEDRRFESGTHAIARAVALAPGLTVVGGGETGSVVGRLGIGNLVGHVSTGGGAMLHYLVHGDLPALAVVRGARHLS
jgi:phosphoglycerate kinase